jgi:selenocysteine lyase/cysteine desulfurase
MADIDSAARRRMLAGLASAAALGSTAGSGVASRALADDADPASAPSSATPAGAAPSALARDEDYWAEVGQHYDRTAGITNLEHGYWGRMARPVRERYLQATTRVDVDGAWYARREFGDDYREAVSRIARALGAHDDEIVITRNATEAIHNLIRQYRSLAPGDAVLYADVDYPAFKRLVRSLQRSHGVELVRVDLPPRASREQVLARYLAAFDAHPRLKLMLATHASNQHGLVTPMRAIADAARARNIDVVCDAAQSWGLVDLSIDDLGVDWAGFNLHKWIGAPLGLGVLYMRRGTLAKIAPYPGESDPDNTGAATRIHSGTTNFAAVLAIPAALDFHEAVGGSNKEARLRYLRGLWTAVADTLPDIEVLGGVDEASWSGIGAFRLRGRASVPDAKALQQQLEQQFGVFTVVRRGLDSGACVRVTPQVFTRPREIERLVDALGVLRA